MKILNANIYTYTNMLNALKIDNISFPVKIGFYLHKNIKNINKANDYIEQNRMSIAKRFGKLNEDKSAYTIPIESCNIVQQELNDLLSIEQEVDIHIFKLSEFENIELTYEQLDAIAFMIEE